jgi:hypothetical protein
VLTEPSKDRPLPNGPAIDKAPEKSKLVPALWVTTGVLGVAAIASGIVAYRASSKLEDKREQFPIDRESLKDQADKVKLYSHLGDGLGIAAIAAGGLALTFTILNKPDKETKGSGRESRVTVGVMPGGVVVGRTF